MNTEIQKLRQEAQRLNAAADRLEEGARAEAARVLITSLRVKREDIAWSSGERVPWFGHIASFHRWLLDSHCEKRFVEWNGWIGFLAELAHHRMPRLFSVADLKAFEASAPRSPRPPC